MTDEQKSAYVVAMAACAQMEALGMLAENQNSIITTAGGKVVPYRKVDFDALANKYGIHHNAVLSLFHGG